MEYIKAVCPNECNANFEATGHVAQTWNVDAYGEFVDMIDECTDVLHNPNHSDVWNCLECGSEAEFIRETSLNQKENN